MNYYSCATERKSTRKFKEKAVSESDIKKINEFLGKCKKLLPEIAVDIRILDRKTAPNLAGCLGYKDYLIEAPHYILITSEKADNYLENAGYIGEDIILRLTDMGIETCWITISDAAKLADRLRISDGKVPAGFIAFGQENRTVKTDRLDIVNVSNVTLKKRSKYDAPKLYIDDSLLAEDMGIKADHSTLDSYTDLYRALVAACCSPSYLNIQPYRFIINDGLFMLVALDDKETDPEDAKLDLGIVMLNFYATLSQRSGVYGKWSFDVPPEEAAKVKDAVPDKGKIVACIKI